MEALPPNPDEYETLVADSVAKLFSVEAGILGSLLERLRHHPVFKNACRPCPGATPELASSWWQQRGGLPPSLDFLTDWMNKGLQPVFCGVSFCFSSSSPTSYLPIPYVEARSSFRRFAEAFLLTRADDLPAPVTGNAEPAARAVSHALLNVSYEVRLNDKPPLGYLAQAHVNCEPLYIPDVSVLTPSKSAARNEERFLAMASVVYLPVAGGALPKVALSAGEQAPVVLILWSPLPGRWDDLYPASQGAVRTIADPALAPRTLAEDLRWLGEDHLHLENAHTLADAMFVGFVFALDRALNDCGEAGKQVRRRLAHGRLLDLRRELLRPVRTSAPVKEWLRKHLRNSVIVPVTNVLSSWTRDSLPVSLTLRRADGSESHESTLQNLDDLLLRIPDNLALRAPQELAAVVLEDAAASVTENGRALLGLALDVSEEYCTVSVYFEPGEEEGKNLFGSSEAFMRYAATRRGFLVPSRRGLGLDLALYTRLPARLGVYRRLYLSVDGSNWHVGAAFPIK